MLLRLFVPLLCFDWWCLCSIISPPLRHPSSLSRSLSLSEFISISRPSFFHFQLFHLYSSLILLFSLYFLVFFVFRPSFSSRLLAFTLLLLASPSFPLTPTFQFYIALAFSFLLLFILFFSLVKPCLVAFVEIPLPRQPSHSLSSSHLFSLFFSPLFIYFCK